MERGAFMRKTDSRQHNTKLQMITALILGALLALGIELIVLLR